MHYMFKVRYKTSNIIDIHIFSLGISIYISSIAMLILHKYSKYQTILLVVL